MAGFFPICWLKHGERVGRVCSREEGQRMAVVLKVLDWILARLARSYDKLEGADTPPLRESKRPDTKKS